MRSVLSLRNDARTFLGTGKTIARICTDVLMNVPMSALPPQVPKSSEVECRTGGRSVRAAAQEANRRMAGMVDSDDYDDYDDQKEFVNDREFGNGREFVNGREFEGRRSERIRGVRAEEERRLKMLKDERRHRFNTRQNGYKIGMEEKMEEQMEERMDQKIEEMVEKGEEKNTEENDGSSVEEMNRTEVVDIKEKVV